ncbi:MAG TPA: host attachment protein [Solirubrobacteraceae bacterium]|nr:host attachment protein [Solirubrobacteraceae bacterium]
MHANDVTPETVRRLAGLRARNGKILSLYLDLDPQTHDTPRARSSAVNSLLSDARQRVEDYTDADHDAKAGLREDLERLEDLLAPDALPGDGTRGLAVFVSGPDDLLEVVRLPRPVSSQVVVDEAPHVEPLTAFEEHGRWCVALVNQSLARFFVGVPDGLAEVGGFDDDTKGRQEQLRHTRGENEEAHQHLRRVAAALALGLRRKRFDRLLLACPQEQRSSIEQALPPEVRQRLAGHLTLDVPDVTPEEVRSAVRETMVEAAAHELEDRLARFTELRAQGALSAGGLDEVLAALVERRVETLLIHDTFSRPGLHDPDTGWLGIEGQRPPTEGRVDRVDDITPYATDLALEQDADVITVTASEHHELEGEDGIAAILRFDR